MRYCGKDLDHRVEKEQALFVWSKFLSFGKRAESRFNLGSELRDLSGGVAKGLAQLLVVLLFANPAAKGFHEW